MQLAVVFSYIYCTLTIRTQKTMKRPDGKKYVKSQVHNCAASHSTRGLWTGRNPNALKPTWGVRQRALLIFG